ncbi:MAG TPA: hypothetical protein VFX49_13775, partial [Chloroflexota bacterium]|nr:hypothetical protein [Chloroflexota bacterium]
MAGASTAVCVPPRGELRTFEVHNAEVAAVWTAYRRGRPTRVPVIFGINPRYTMDDRSANSRRVT